MKSLVIAFALIASPFSSLACPGGNLKSLSINGQQVAEINMTDSSIRLTDSTAKIMAISTIKSNSYNSIEQCGHEMACKASEVLAVDVLEDPKAIVVVYIRKANEHSSAIFKITNFHQTRSANSCAEIVEPLK